MIVTLLVGIAIAGAAGLLQLDGVRLELARPVFTMPSLSLAAVFGIALPLFIVTMASQNVPGVAVIRASGYHVPISPVIGWTGVANVLLAPFGAFALNLAAITAAICMGREAHEDPAAALRGRRSAPACSTCSSACSARRSRRCSRAFPKELVMAIAGIALFGTIGNSLAAAMREEHDREPALITFLVTASGVSLAGIGSAFWGLVAGARDLAGLSPQKAARNYACRSDQSQLVSWALDSHQHGACRWALTKRTWLRSAM